MLPGCHPLASRGSTRIAQLFLQVTVGLRMVASTMRAGTILLSLLVAACLAALCAANTPLDDWVEGIATNYGGPADSMDPSNPSFGTSVVSAYNPGTACRAVGMFYC